MTSSQVGGATRNRDTRAAHRTALGHSDARGTILVIACHRADAALRYDRTTKRQPERLRRPALAFARARLQLEWHSPAISPMLFYLLRAFCQTSPLSPAAMARPDRGALTRSKVEPTLVPIF